MADKVKETESAAEDRRRFRREAAIALASAYIAKHGGFGVPVIQEGNVRQIWALADMLVEMENAPAPAVIPAQETVKSSLRAVHPSDEFAVIMSDGKKRGGFITEEEAQDFARGKQGARVVQTSGPGADEARIAPATVAV